MDKEEYESKFDDLEAERTRLTEQRVSLETDLCEINIQIDHLNEVLMHLAPLAGISINQGISGMGMTDAIRHIMEHTSDKKSANDIRQQLELRGFDMSGMSSPMASIYKTLSRLVDDSHELERIKEDGKVFFRSPTSTEITDDDIPF